MAAKKNLKPVDPIPSVKKPGDGIVINQITVRPVIRTRSDTAQWRSALQAAEWNTYQIRVTLYDLYDDCLLDAVLNDQVDKLRMAVTSPQLQFMRDGEEVPEIMDLINTEAFYDLLSEIVNTRLWGITVGEFSFDGEGGFTFNNIPRKHIRPLLGMIAKEQYGPGEINYRQPPTSNYIIELGKPRDLGKLLKVVPYVLYKRGGFSDWAQFSEIFGMPTRVAKYDASNQQARIEAERALNEAGAALSVVIPKEVEFSLEQPTANLNGDIYDKLLDKCDKQICTLILGQTESTMSSTSSGYAQSKTHQQTKHEVQEDTRKYILRILNSKVKDLFKLNGLPVGGGSFIYSEDSEEVQMSDKIDIWVKAKQLGLPIADDDMYEVFDIPKPDNYDELKQQAVDAAEAAKEALQNNGANDPITKKAQMRARKLWKQFTDFFDQAPD